MSAHRASPTLSVIVPAYRAAPLLPRVLPAIRAAAAAAPAMPAVELLVVVDGGDEATARVANAYADRVHLLADGPHGPAHARNVGASLARGEVLVFVDADVIIAHDALAAIAEHFAVDPALCGLFGAYDDAPEAPAFVSVYRNLVHRYVHLEFAGASDSFWAGLGAVRRTVFQAVGGFDAGRYPRPQIEDIELGYRLRDRGARVRLDPTITGRHLKAWTLSSMIRADFFDRAVPWARLLRDRRTLWHTTTLNLAWRERVNVAATALLLAACAAWILAPRPVFAIAAATAALLVIAGNAGLLGWLVRTRGVLFALGAVPLRFVHYVLSLGAVGASLLPTPSARVRPAPLAEAAAQAVRDGTGTGSASRSAK